VTWRRFPRLWMEPGVDALAPTPLGQADPERAQVRPPAERRQRSVGPTPTRRRSTSPEPDRRIHKAPCTEGLKESMQMTTTEASGRAGRVRVEQGAKRVRAYLGGQVVADTTQPRLVWEVPYYPDGPWLRGGAEAGDRRGGRPRPDGGVRAAVPPAGRGRRGGFRRGPGAAARRAGDAGSVLPRIRSRIQASQLQVLQSSARLVHTRTLDEFAADNAKKGEVCGTARSVGQVSR
jgi:hypothetical protein